MWSCAINRDQWGASVKLVDARLQRRLIGLFDGPFLGTPTLIGPWGCLAALPHHQGLTDSFNEACHHWESARHQTSIGLCDVHRVLISRQWRGGKKKTPVGDGQPWPAFEYFSIYRVSVLSVGDAQKRHTGGWLWWIFYNSKGRGGKKKEKSRRSRILQAVIWMSLYVAVIVLGYNCIFSSFGTL